MEHSYTDEMECLFTLIINQMGTVRNKPQLLEWFHLLKPAAVAPLDGCFYSEDDGSLHNIYHLSFNWVNQKHPASRPGNNDVC